MECRERKSLINESGRTDGWSWPPPATGYRANTKCVCVNLTNKAYSCPTPAADYYSTIARVHDEQYRRAWAEGSLHNERKCTFRRDGAMKIPIWRSHDPIDRVGELFIEIFHADDNDRPIFVNRECPVGDP